MSDLVTMLQTGKDVDVEFTKDIVNLECYPEAGMRATLLAVAQNANGDVLKVRLSYKKYDNFNKAFESRNYWGRLSNDQDPSSSDYTARETGNYTVEDEIFVMADDDVAEFMTVMTQHELFTEWETGTKEVSYVAWLEDRVRQLENHVCIR